MIPSRLLVSNWFNLYFALVLSLIFIRPTHAGPIILKSELFDFICEVEVAVGPDSPINIERVLEFPGVKVDDEYVNGVIYEGEHHLCYRRSSIVDDCNSAMNDWVCYSNPSDTPQIVPIY